MLSSQSACLMVLCVMLTSRLAQCCSCPSCNYSDMAAKCQCCIYRQIGKRADNPSFSSLSSSPSSFSSSSSSEPSSPLLRSPSSRYLPLPRAMLAQATSPQTFSSDLLSELLRAASLTDNYNNNNKNNAFIGVADAKQQEQQQQHGDGDVRMNAANDDDDDDDVVAALMTRGLRHQMTSEEEEKEESRRLRADGYALAQALLKAAQP